MIDYDKLLRESRNKKFEKLNDLKEFKVNPYSCNYSEGNKHDCCEHNHCVLDECWLETDAKKNLLKEQLKEEQVFLENGEGCVGYDKLEITKNILRLKKELKKC